MNKKWPLFAGVGMGVCLLLGALFGPNQAETEAKQRAQVEALCKGIENTGGACTDRSDPRKVVIELSDPIAATMTKRQFEMLGDSLRNAAPDVMVSVRTRQGRVLMTVDRFGNSIRVE